MLKYSLTFLIASLPALTVASEGPSPRLQDMAVEQLQALSQPNPQRIAAICALDVARPEPVAALVTARALPDGSITPCLRG